MSAGSLRQQFLYYLKDNHPVLIPFVIDANDEERRKNLPYSLKNFQIQVGEDEIVVQFYSFHEHFIYEDQPRIEGFREIVNLSMDIIQEKVILIEVVKSNGKIASSMLQGPNKPITDVVGGTILKRRFGE